MDASGDYYALQLESLATATCVTMDLLFMYEL
jgi:hypothetical protein